MLMGLLQPEDAPMNGQENDVLDEQLAYYRARAPEYNDWYYRRGRYEVPPERRQQWFAELEILERALYELPPITDALELAGGTGIWTEKLAQVCNSVLVLDASEEMIAISSSRVGQNNVGYRQQDLFDWQPSEKYDLVFAAFWLSHIPPSRLAAFLSATRKAMAISGKVFFTDGLHNPNSVANDHQLEEPGSLLQLRKLNDGRQFHVVKVFYDPRQLVAECRRAGIQLTMRTTGDFFWYGIGELL